MFSIHVSCNPGEMEHFNERIWKQTIQIQFLKRHDWQKSLCTNYLWLFQLSRDVTAHHISDHLKYFGLNRFGNAICVLFSSALVWAAVWKQGKQENTKVLLNTFIIAFRKDNCTSRLFTSTVFSTCMITLTQHTYLSTERRHKDSFYLFFGFSISELF